MKRWLSIGVWLCLPLLLCADEPLRLRVLSYNIHHGAGVDGKLDLARIAKVILSVQPDLVALQEVDQRASRSNKVDQPKELARLTKMHVAFGANIPLQGGHYGNAILSRFPILSSKNRLLPNVRNGEQRGALFAMVRTHADRKPLLFVATHFDHRRDDQERQLSSEAINRWGQSSKHPAILAGDLNDTLKSPALTKLREVWTVSNQHPMPTVPVSNPKRQIDFILYRTAKSWKMVEVKVLPEKVASDHRAVLAVLEWSGSKARDPSDKR